MADLVSYSTALSSLAQSLPGDLSALPFCITAASTAIERFCGRVFSVASYDEIVTPTGGRADRGEPASANLSYFPVTAVSRVSGGRITALTIVNTDSATNQVARVAFTFTGDVTLPDLVYTGLTLTTIASGAVTAQSITWTTASPYTTIQAVANSINALGNGWTATVSSLLGGWAAAEFVGAKSVKPGFSPGTALDIFATDLPNQSVDYASGILSIGPGPVLGTSGYGYWQGDANDWNDTDAPAGYQQVRVQYTAGFAVIPYDVQQACLLTIKAYLQQLQTVTQYKSETDDKWKYELAGIEEQEIPDSAKRILTRYKARWM